MVLLHVKPPPVMRIRKTPKVCNFFYSNPNWAQFCELRAFWQLPSSGIGVEILWRPPPFHEVGLEPRPEAQEIAFFSFTFTFPWNTQHNRRMATRDRDQLRCFHHKVGLWNLQSSYVLLCWFVFNSVSQEYVCPFRQGQGRRDFKWGTCKG